MRKLCSLPVCCGVLAAVFCTAASSEAVREFQEARELFNQQQWDEAQAAAEKALAADPNMGDAEILLGLIATVGSRFGVAERHFLRAVALEPENYQAYDYLGSTYLQEKKLAEAMHAFEKALALKPGNPAANYNLGVIAIQRESAAEALRRFQAVLRVSNADVPALTGVLNAELALRKTADARRTAAQLEALLPDSDSRLLQVAALLAEYGDPATAIPILERVRRSAPESWGLDYNLAIAYFQTAQYDRAADVLHPFIGAQGKAEAFDLLGAVNERRGRASDAEHAFEQAAAREPANPDYRFDYGNSLVQHGNISSALTVFRSAVADFPDSWKLRIGLGSAYYLSGDYENAGVALLEAVRLKPDAVPAWFLLGEAYESVSDLQREIQTAFAAYIKTAPRDAWAYYHYGSILHGLNNNPAAINNFNEALRLNPDFAEAYLELGVIALAEGKTEQSVADLQKAISLEPELAPAHYRLGLAYKRIGDEARAQEELTRFRALKENNRQRDRVLDSLSAIAVNEPRAGEQP